MGSSTISGLHLPLLLPVLKATVILVAALGITFGMQRTSAGARHLVWLVTLAALLLVPALDAWAPLRFAVLPPESWSAPAQRFDLPAPLGTLRTAKPPALPSRTLVVPEGKAPESIAVVGDVARPYPSVAVLMFALWAAVLAGIVLSLGYATFAVRRIVRRSRPLTERAWLDPLYEVADRLGLAEVPRVLRSHDAKMPFACGLITPTIVLPADCDEWSADRRRAVLLHELAHIRRRDLIGHTIGRLVCAVYWFHPLVWTAAKRLRAESERACDDLALACGTRAADYAEHLLDIVTSVRGDATPAVALAMARRKEFEGRMLAILDNGVRHSTPSRRQAATLTATLALIALVVSAAAPTPRAAPARVAAAPSAASPWSPPNSSRQPYHDARVIVRVEPTVHPPSGTATVAVTATSSRIATMMSTVMAAATPSSAAAAASVGRQKGDSDDRPVLLAKVLRSDTSAALRRVAAWGLREYVDQSAAAARALANALRVDGSSLVREMAAWSLSDCKDSAATDALAAAVRGDADERVRATAAWALGHGRDGAQVAALAAALGDPSRDVRVRAAWALGNTGVREAPAALVALLGDKDAHLRTLAAWSLFRIKDPRTAPALETALKSEPDKDVQMAELRAIATLGERSVDALRSLLESSDPRVKSMAVHALAGGQAAGPWPWPWPEPRPYP